MSPPTLSSILRGWKRDIASLSGQPSPLNVPAISRGFGNAMLGTWSLGLERSIGNVTASATYVGTTAYKLARNSFPNAYPGATAAFARFTRIQRGRSSRRRLRYRESRSHRLRTPAITLFSFQPLVRRRMVVPECRASYTWSKSIDDTSTVAGTSATSTVGAIAQAAPQNPFDTHPERGPSTFDATHSFSLSLTQEIPTSSALLFGWSEPEDRRGLAADQHLQH